MVHKNDRFRARRLVDLLIRIQNPYLAFLVLHSLGSMNAFNVESLPNSRVKR